MSTILVSASVIANIVNAQNITGTLDAVNAAFTGRPPLVFTAGTGAGQVSNYWASARTLAPSANETLDLTALTDSLGNTVTFSALKALLLSTPISNLNDITAGNAAANAWVGPMGAATTTITLQAGGGGIILWSPNGWTVDATHKNLKVVNAAGVNAVSYNIIALGN